jgi:hypothetical protein
MAKRHRGGKRSHMKKGGKRRGKRGRKRGRK